MGAPEGEGRYSHAGWTLSCVEFDASAYELKGRDQDEAAALLVGRRSDEAFAPGWPTMTEEFAGHNPLPRYVGGDVTTRVATSCADR